MNSSASSIVEGSTGKAQESDQDPKPNIPLRQRRLPASFWQEPCIAPSTPNRETVHSASAASTSHQFPMTSLHPWTVNSNSAMLPVFLPQHFVAPNHFLVAQNSNPQWIRGSTNCCTCATCLNYSYGIPRVPDVYNGLRYRPAINMPCPAVNCIDQSCKLCSASERWHPERLRHFRLRAARYNAILD